ncbi:MAG: energy transducer TonB [Bacteroidales bacterium]|nr:energy transducer TonB [Bacteroidales bacterium]
MKYINKQVNIDVEAHYPQGEMALYSHFFQNLKFPEEAKKKTIDAVISLSYEVMPDSTVGNITVLKKIGYGVDEEITKILKPLKFAPRIEEGVPVRSNMMLNIPIQRRGDL